MVSDLPDDIRRIVLERLSANDFQTAKAIHDHWINTRTQTQPATLHRPSRQSHTPPQYRHMH